MDRDRNSHPTDVSEPPTARGVLPPLAGITGPSLLVLVGMLLLRTVLLFVGDTVAFALLRLGDPAATWDQAVMWGNVTVVVADVVTLVVVALLLRRSGSSLAALLRTRTPGRDIAWGLLIGVICLVGFFVTNFIGNLIAYFGPPPVPTGAAYHPPLWLGLWSLLLMPVTIAVAEEVLYRGYLQSVLTLRWGRWAGLVVMAAAFSVQHLALTPLDGQAWLARTISLFCFGIILGLLGWWMKRLWPLIIGHWLLDVIGLGLPMLIASTGGF